MGTVQMVILVSIFNIALTALIGGIVVYVVQKKIDAALQKSLVEHQTKFTISYAKTIETLENLYKKFVAFNNAVNESIDARRHFREEDRQWDEKSDRADALLIDFWNYYKVNRLFLPDELAKIIADLHEQVKYVTLIIKLTLGSAKTRLQPGAKSWEGEQLITFVWESKRLESVFTKYENPEPLLAEMLDELKRYTGYLETSYKSVAEAK